MNGRLVGVQQYGLLSGAAVVVFLQARNPRRFQAAAEVAGARFHFRYHLSQHRFGVAHDAEVYVAVVRYFARLDVDLNHLSVRRKAPAVVDHPVHSRADDQHQVRLSQRRAARALEGYGVILRHDAARHRRGVERGACEIHKPLQFGRGACEEHAAAREYDGTLRRRQHIHRLFDRRRIARGNGLARRAGGRNRIVFFNLFVQHIGAAVDVHGAGSARHRLPIRRADDFGIARRHCGAMPILAYRLHNALLVNFLEGFPADFVNRACAAEYHHRRAVDGRRIDAGEQVERAGAACRRADAGLAGNAGVGVRRKRRRLLMPKVDRLYAEILAAHHNVEVGPAHQIEELLHALFLERLRYKVASGNLCHNKTP